MSYYFTSDNFIENIKIIQGSPERAKRKCICQSCANHIQKGEKRINLLSGMKNSMGFLCESCAKEFIANDIKLLQEGIEEFKELALKLKHLEEYVIEERI